MKLYHGSNTGIESINLAMCRPYKDLLCNQWKIFGKLHSLHILKASKMHDNIKQSERMVMLERISQ